MAAVDKIYGDKKHYNQFRAWCYEYKPEALKYFYPWDTDDEYEHVICSFSEDIDMWMIEHCDIVWVVAYIKYQYDMGNLSDYLFTKDISGE